MGKGYNHNDYMDSALAPIEAQRDDALEELAKVQAERDELLNRISELERETFALRTDLGFAKRSWGRQVIELTDKLRKATEGGE